MKIYVQTINFKNMTLKKCFGNFAPLITGKIRVIGKKKRHIV
jgi:hypothetical protein